MLESLCRFFVAPLLSCPTPASDWLFLPASGCRSRRRWEDVLARWFMLVTIGSEVGCAHKIPGRRQHHRQQQAAGRSVARLLLLQHLPSQKPARAHDKAQKRVTFTAAETEHNQLRVMPRGFWRELITLRTSPSISQGDEVRGTASTEATALV